MFKSEAWILFMVICHLYIWMSRLLLVMFPINCRFVQLPSHIFLIQRPLLMWCQVLQRHVDYFNKFLMSSNFNLIFMIDLDCNGQIENNFAKNYLIAQSL
jgi:hypothetical protein